MIPNIAFLLLDKVTPCMFQNKKKNNILNVQNIRNEECLQSSLGLVLNKRIRGYFIIYT